MNRCRIDVFGACSWIVLFAGLSLPATAQQVGRAYDGLDAGRDAYEYHEAERQRQIGRQLNTIDQMKWYSGIPQSYDDQTTYYRSPPSLSYAYATGHRGVLGASLRANWARPYDMFEPWPYIPGDIWGYIWNDSVRQPIGQRQVQTGPNRWESHPVYAISPAPPTTRATEPPPPPIAAPAERSRPSHGPREF